MPLECGIIFDGIPEGAIPRKVGLIWGIPVEYGGCPCSPMCAGFFVAWIPGRMKMVGGFRRTQYRSVERTATAAYPAASKSLTYLCSTLEPTSLCSCRSWFLSSFQEKRGTLTLYHRTGVRYAWRWLDGLSGQPYAPTRSGRCGARLESYRKRSMRIAKSTPDPASKTPHEFSGLCHSSHLYHHITDYR